MPDLALLNVWSSKRTIGCYGDSISDYNSDGVGNDQYLTYTPRGYLAWAQVLSNWRFDFDPNNNFGVSGNTTSQMLARLSSVLAADLDVCCVLGGTNDLVGGVSVATVIANLTAIYDALYAAGTTVVAIPIMGRSSGSSPLSAAQILRGQSINAWIRKQAYIRQNFYVCDFGPVWDDPLSTAWAERSGYAGDNIHPDPIGAYAIGTKLATLLSSISPLAYNPLSNGADAFDATDNPYGNIVTNGAFLGTAGTTTGGPTGTVADGWILDGSNAGGATVVGSKTTMSDGRAAQQIAISGTYTGSAKQIQLRRSLTFGNFLSGNTVFGEIEFSLVNTSGIAGVDMQFYTTEGGTSYWRKALPSVSTTLAPASAAGLLRTPKRLLTADATGAYCYLMIDLKTTAASDPCVGTIKFASAAIRKV